MKKFNKLSMYFILVPLFVLAVTSCSKKEPEVSAISNGLGGVQVMSCKDLQLFDSNQECKKSTFAKCVVRQVVVSEASIDCYQPVSGFELCSMPANRPIWTYGISSPWCIETSARENVVFRKTVSQANCDVRGNNQCDCVEAPQTLVRCSLKGKQFPSCPKPLRSIVYCEKSLNPPIHEPEIHTKI